MARNGLFKLYAILSEYLFLALDGFLIDVCLFAKVFIATRELLVGAGANVQKPRCSTCKDVLVEPARANMRKNIVVYKLKQKFVGWNKGGKEAQRKVIAKERRKRVAN